jgi:hypothetical protein
VVAHIALSCVEIEEFRALIKLLNEGIFEFLYKTGDTIKRLVLADFKRRKERVKNDLHTARSKIYISFDLWTSLNRLAMVGVVAYYLTSDLISRSLLIGLRSLEGPYTGENLAACVIDVLIDFELGSLVGYFVSDNDSTNDVAVKAICKDLELGIAEGRRLRCLGYIINLSAKAFLFGTEEGSFDFEISDVAKMKSEVRQALELLVF